MKNIKLSLCELFEKYAKVFIPDIQRDYVMGSGDDNLRNLFDSMERSCFEGENFNFSCIMGYVDESDNLYIYDGQQRLVTLIYLCAYLYCNSNLENKTIEKLNKFNFITRKEANTYLKNLLIKDKESKINIVDFTTFSIENLIEVFKEKKYFKTKQCYSTYDKQISLEFLFEKVKFEIVIVNKVGDAEQFFMDLNDGLQLEEYEIFKAELNHKANQLLKDENEFKEFAGLLDNKWLNFFFSYRSNERCEEEIEMKFIQFCLRMIYIEKKENDNDYREDNIDWIEIEDIKRIHNILEEICEIFKNKSLLNQKDKKYINYTEEVSGYHEYRGGYWNLNDNNYVCMLDEFIKSLSLKEYDNQQKYDVLIWCFISKNTVNNNEELRFIKKLLNYNRIINKKAMFSRNYKLYYAKYSVYGIPLYYGKNFANFDINKEYDDDKKLFMCNVISLNALLRKVRIENAIDTILSNKENKNFLDDFKNAINLEKEKFKLSKYNGYIEWLENQPYFNGLIYNILDKIEIINGKIFDKCDMSLKDIYKYLVKLGITHKYVMESGITVRWPTYENNNVQKYSFENNCQVIYTNKIDFLTDNYYDKKIIDQWLSDKEEENIFNKKNDLNLKYWKELPGGWYINENILRYPNTDDSGRNFLSVNSKIYDIPVASIDNINNYIKDSMKEMYYDNIKNKLFYNKKEVTWSTPSVIFDQKEFIKEKCIEYDKIYYSENKNVMNIIISICMELNPFDVKQINYDRIRCIYDKCYFIPGENLKYYNEKVMKK